MGQIHRLAKKQMKKKNIRDLIRHISETNDSSSAILQSPLSTSEKENRIRTLLVNPGTASDISLTGLTIGDLFYDMLRVDPDVIKGIDFARAEDIGDLFKFSVYSDKLSSLTEDSFEGTIHNLKGFVGERFVAQELSAAGMEVEFPDNPNQEGFDLLVNGQPFQVKCVADESAVYDHFERYPDIPVFANEEIASSLEGVDNVYTVKGFSLSEIENSTRESIESGVEILDCEIPLIVTSVAIGKNAYYMLNNKTDMQSASVNVTYDIAGGLVGGELGSSTMSLLGGLLGPYGIVVGGVIGAIGGATSGRRLFSRIKKIFHSRKEEKLAWIALQDFIKAAYNSSKKSRAIFEKKTGKIEDNLKNKTGVAANIEEYVIPRIKEERKYLNDKIKKLYDFKDKPENLDYVNCDILVASINAISLSLKAKVHPAAIIDSVDNLTESMKILQEKRSKLLV